MRKQITSLFQQINRRGFLGGAIGLAAGGISLPAFAADTTMSAKQAYKKAKSGEIILVDIRTPGEWAQTGIGEGAIGLDMTAKTFVDSLVKLRTDYPEKPIAIICRTGNRTGYVFSQLASQGFPGLVDVSEGMAGGPNGRGWIPRGLPVYAGTKANIKKYLHAIMAK